ncbi:hypothetical protein [Planobispora longispora]|nr:hypothetical protein [Planobispora longispora]
MFETQSSTPATPPPASPAPGPQAGGGSPYGAPGQGSWPPVPAAPARGPENGGWGPSADPFAKPDPLTSADPFARHDPLTSADPFTKPDPLTSADPFARHDPLTSADPFARSTPFAQTSTFSVPAPAGTGRPGDGGHPGNGAPIGNGGPAGNGGHPGGGDRPGQGRPQSPQLPPGGHLSRDPSDPNRPFVTAGQISGPKTPPPERQQELWNTVFGDNYQAIGDENELEEAGRPVWVFALAGSAVIALVAALIWAFLAGPLASADETTEPVSEAKPSAAPKKTAKPKIGRLPSYPGEGSPVAGTLTDAGSALSLARLGAPWRQDTRPTMPTTYGFNTRQYTLTGQDSNGKNQYAQVLSGPLSPRLQKHYASPENLAPVINAVANAARNKFFPEGNKASKVAQQTLKVGDLPAQLAAYEITSGMDKTTIVVAAVSTGADLPSIVYMSVPASATELLPDINTVFKSIKAAAAG